MKSSKKSRLVLVLLAIIVLAVIGGVALWKWNKSKKSSDSSPTKIPLNQLSDQELEKCLLEDFSRRLDLQKYFVFSLKELTKERIKIDNETWVNGRIVKSALFKDLTKIAKPHTSLYKKNAILFVNETYKKTVDEWKGAKLDEKIDNGKDYYLIFEKNAEIKNTYFYGGEESSFIFVKVIPADEHVFKSKDEALSFLKKDPALSNN